MPRPFDHLVLAARDLEAQAQFYRRAGFLVGPRNVHPWGTQNHIVQLGGEFLELIGIGPDFIAPPSGGGATNWSFGSFISHYLRGQEGLAMLALRSDDAGVDEAAYSAAGYGGIAPFHFGRNGVRADGSQAGVAFTLAFARTSLIERAGFFACQHHHPENFWSPALQNHPNGALRVESVALCAENPAAHAEFLGVFLGQRLMHSTSMGLEMETGGGRVDVLIPPAFAFRYGLPAQRTDSPCFAGYCLAVSDLTRAKACLEQGQIAFHVQEAAVVVPPQAAFGAAIRFIQSRQEAL